MANQVGIALFGLGRAGSIRFENIRMDYRAKLLYIVELDMNKAAQLVKKYDLKINVVSPDEAYKVYEDTSVNGVIVCSPTLSHEEIVRNSLKHGKAVFCEKPISTTLEGVKACYKEAEKASKPLLCSFNRRFDPTVRLLRNQVKGGKIGTVHVIKTCSRDHPLPPLDFLRMSGGFFHDCAIHDIDMICWVLGELPKSVFAQGHAHMKHIADMNDIDTTSIVMKFPSGTIATVDLSRHSNYGYDQRLEVFGSDGMLTSENEHKSQLVSYNQDGIRSDCLKHSFQERYERSFVESVNHFIDVMNEKEEASVSELDTVNATILVTACHKSYQTGLPVTLTCADGQLII